MHAVMSIWDEELNSIAIHYFNARKGNIGRKYKYSGLAKGAAGSSRLVRRHFDF